MTTIQVYVKEIGQILTVYFLAIKYWIQGDDWEKAVEDAKAIVRGWK